MVIHSITVGMYSLQSMPQRSAFATAEWQFDCTPALMLVLLIRQSDTALIVCDNNMFHAEMIDGMFGTTLHSLNPHHPLAAHEHSIS
jgi:hypothetical protein